MRTDKVRIPLESILYLGILAVALLLRFVVLDYAPLTDAEAVNALAATSVTPSASPFWMEGQRIVPQSPAYHVLSSALFQLFGTSDAGARIIPAFAGLAFVAAAVFLRRIFQRPTALIFTVLLAISPVLVTGSRSANGDMLALLGLLTAVWLVLAIYRGDIRGDKLPLAAAAFGLALTAGKSGWHGALTLVIGAFFIWLGRASLALERRWQPSRSELLQGIFVALGTVVLFSTGFGFSWSSFAGIGEGFGVWIAGWFTRSATSALTMLAMLILYEPLITIFGVYGAFRAMRTKDAVGVMAGRWALAAVLVILLYPSRSAPDLMWIIVPLAYLASTALVDILERILIWRTSMEFLGLSVLLLVLTLFCYLQLAAYSSGTGPSYDILDPGLRIWIIGGVVILGGLSILFFGLGWGWRLVRNAVALVSSLTLLLIMISAVWHLNFTSQALQAKDLWRTQVTTQGIRLLDDTLVNLSRVKTAGEEPMVIKVLGGATPSMAWTLRGWEAAGSDEMTAGNALPILLAREQASIPAAAEDYIGQAIKISERKGWIGTLPPEPVRWWVRGEAPTIDESWALFVRRDLARLGEGQLSEFENDFEGE
jgi:4-amino-4-deoxy-L-arabinose transferase-like glycosyltransferase